MRLSEAMRLGSMVTPQGFGRLARTRRKYLFGLVGPVVRETCALGAAYLAVKADMVQVVSDGGSHRSFRGDVVIPAGQLLWETSPPADWVPLMWAEVACPECGAVDRIFRMIPHLNDFHRWTRGEIADFVERLERAHDASIRPIEVVHE